MVIYELIMAEMLYKGFTTFILNVKLARKKRSEKKA
jgi:hypothetical protein